MSGFEPDLVRICGIYCGFCPVFKVECLGCLKDPFKVGVFSIYALPIRRSDAVFSVGNFLLKPTTKKESIRSMHWTTGDEL